MKTELNKPCEGSKTFARLVEAQVEFRNLSPIGVIYGLIAVESIVWRVCYNWRQVSQTVKKQEKYNAIY